MTREDWVARGLRLEYLTLGWNLIEALVAIISGWMAGSIALVGFGLDSVVESSSGLVLLWRLRAEDYGGRREQVERLSVKLVGAGFLVLAAYVSVDAVKSLLRHEAPEQSLAGIVIVAASLIVMPWLAHAKRQVARGLESSAMQADSRQTDICAYLSAIVLGGLVLNSALGWWWADPVAALAIVPLIAHEGVEALKGKTCCGDPCR